MFFVAQMGPLCDWSERTLLEGESAPHRYVSSVQVSSAGCLDQRRNFYPVLWRLE